MVSTYSRQGSVGIPSILRVESFTLLFKALPWILGKRRDRRGTSTGSLFVTRSFHLLLAGQGIITLP